jgi:hypothetical protein
VAAPTIRNPDFLIIGAPKSGTTWLNRRLASHPEIAMPDDEVHFFSDHWDRGWPWYMTRLPVQHDGGMLGENSNSYLTDPAALSRIVSAVPHAKLICLLRHPVERAYSSYGMQIDRGRATGEINLYLDPLHSPRPHILTNGEYGRMLKPYYDAFGAQQIHVAFFDEITADPARLYANVLDFLGVASDYVPANLLERENARKQSGIPGPIKRALWWLRPALDRPAARALRQGWAGQKIERALSRSKRYPPLPADTAAMLADYYADDLASLEKLTGHDLTEWRSRYRVAAD